MRLVLGTLSNRGVQFLEDGAAKSFVEALSVCLKLDKYAHMSQLTEQQVVHMGELATRWVHAALAFQNAACCCGSLF